jgi:hypothetical protein
LTVTIADRVYPWVLSVGLAVVAFIALDNYLAWQRAANVCDQVLPGASIERILNLKSAVNGQAGLLKVQFVAPAIIRIGGTQFGPPKGDNKLFIATFKGLHYQSRACRVHLTDGKVISKSVSKVVY